MSYIKINNDIITYPYTIEQFKQEHSNTSFTSDLTEDILADFNVYAVEETKPPAIDNDIEYLCKKYPKKIDNNWIIVWEVARLSVEAASANIRAKRNKLLRDSDWTQLLDANNRCDQAAWAVYRQKLCDLPQQDGFPYTVVWPNKPKTI